MVQSELTIRLESFEGPLDLLLYLIQAHELDISSVSLGKVTDQYLDYVRKMHEHHFELASEFLVVAATLLLWKSRALLPQDPTAQTDSTQEENGLLTQEQLLKRLLEHKRFLEAGEQLQQQPLLGIDVFVRPNHKPPIHRIWREMNVTDLALSQQDLATRMRKRSKILKKETVSLNEKIIDFAHLLEMGKPIEMKSLISDPTSIPEIVVTFLASLELARLKKLRLFQQKPYDAVYLELIESLKDFNIGLVTGFNVEATVR